MTKFNWSDYCATEYNRNQCSEDNCILYPKCLIKELRGEEMSLYNIKLYYAYDSKLKRVCVHVLKKGELISLVTGNKRPYNEDEEEK